MYIQIFITSPMIQWDLNPEVHVSTVHKDYAPSELKSFMLMSSAFAFWFSIASLTTIVLAQWLFRKDIRKLNTRTVEWLRQSKQRAEQSRYWRLMRFIREWLRVERSKLRRRNHGQPRSKSPAGSAQQTHARNIPSPGLSREQSLTLESQRDSVCEEQDKDKDGTGSETQ